MPAPGRRHAGWQRRLHLRAERGGHRLTGFAGGGWPEARGPIEPGTTFVDHTVAVNELYVRLIEAERTGEFELLEHQAEPDCWRRFLGPIGECHQLRPDAFVASASASWSSCSLRRGRSRHAKAATALRRKLGATSTTGASAPSSSSTASSPGSSGRLADRATGGGAWRAHRGAAGRGATPLRRRRGGGPARSVARRRRRLEGARHERHRVTATVARGVSHGRRSTAICGAGGWSQADTLWLCRSCPTPQSTRS